jgi:hypothetical protein
MLSGGKGANVLAWLEPDGVSKDPYELFEYPYKTQAIPWNMDTIASLKG